MPSPTRAKKRLGKYLAELRQARGVDQAVIAEELRVSRVSLGRYELGQVLPPWATIQLMLRVLEVTDGERTEALSRWEVANEEPASVRLPVDAPKAFRTFVNAERSAATMRYMAQSTMPGLLQTERYARALFDSAHRFHRPEVNPVSVVNARLQRQQRLESPKNPLKLHVLLDQVALERTVGGPEIMREQCEHLLVVTERAFVTLQVIPFGAGAYGPMGGPCVIVDYPDPDDAPGVYLEYLTGGDWVDNEADVQRFMTMFDDVAGMALPPWDTSDLIRDRAKALGDR